MNSYLVEFPNGAAISVEAINSRMAFLKACADPRGGINMIEESEALEFVMMMVTDHSEGYITDSGVVWVSRQHREQRIREGFDEFIRYRFNRRG